MRFLLPALIATGLMAADPALVLVEAEAFKDTGGWVVDQQFMDVMGSPMLLAHGMGEPVADATTTVTLPAAGTWRVWVRTRDWAATWKAGVAPGTFQVLVDGKPLAATFGTVNAAWHWQDGGTVTTGTNATLALKDLTGFDGRCDAILFAADAAFTPPADGAALATLRRRLLALPDQPEDGGTYDLVVVGGGYGGFCAAVSAARHGLSVALIQNRPVLGGNASSEVRVAPHGELNLPPWPQLGNLVKELTPKKRVNCQDGAIYEDDNKMKVVSAEKNLRLFMETHVDRVDKKGEAIASVTGRHIRTGKELRFTGRYFADCTGDGAVGFLAGADFRVGRESRAETGERRAPEKSDSQVMGTSVMWYAVPAANPKPFPETPWAVPFTDATCQNTVRGDWNWENGMLRDQIAEAERIRDHGLRAVYGNWSFQRNQSKDKAKYANMQLGWVAYVGGKRESRRLLGDVILQEQDIEEQRPHPDACVTATWSIDLHYPEKKNLADFPDEPFRSVADHGKKKPYAFPYRCLYSRNVPNLFMAGRNISVTHVALGTIRVMRTIGVMGEVVGMAASIAKAHDTTPRGVYEKHLDELKGMFAKGVPPAQ